MDLDLQEELESACLDAMRGDPAGPALARRLEAVCRALLTRAGHADAQIRARSDRRGTTVRIVLPEAGKQVEPVVLTMR